MKIGIVAVKGGAGSGNWGHVGRPGLVGGSGGGAGGVLATGKNELYRWSNLAEIHDMFLGKRARSLDVTDKQDFYFAPPSVLKRDRPSWVDRCYGRMIIDKEALGAAGWRKDPQLKVESAWRIYGKDPRVQDDEHIIRSYMGAIKGFEVHDLPKGVSISQVKSWMDYRLDRDVPVVLQGSDWRGD